MPIHPKFIYRFNAILIKIPVRYFGRYRQDYSKMYMDRQRNYNGKAMLENRNKVEGNILPDFNTY